MKTLRRVRDYIEENLVDVVLELAAYDTDIGIKVRELISQDLVEILEDERFAEEVAGPFEGSAEAEVVPLELLVEKENLL